MTRLCLPVLALAAVALGDGFTFSIGNPVAARDFNVKGAVFVFRIEGCADPAKAEVTAAAQGVVNGARKSLTLKLLTASHPGVFAVYRTWPAEGRWTIVLKGACGTSNAGAIIPTGSKGFVRDQSKFYPRPATDAEVEAVLKQLTDGGAK